MTDDNKQENFVSMETLTLKQVVWRIALTIALAEFFIMLLFAVIPFTTNEYLLSFIDVFLLVVCTTPIIYFGIVKKYIIAHQKVVKEIEHLATHDPLTQLANRRLLFVHLEKLMANILRYKKNGLVIAIDLNGFKEINDKFGHDTGDYVLVEIAKRLKASVREGDIVCRLGGDEFVIVLEQLDNELSVAKEQAHMITQKIQSVLNLPINYKGRILSVGASIGLRLLPPVEDSMEKILKEADLAMYQSKSEGKNYVLYSL
jgi:diguanylate cyclase (GGDEF)-like protein